MKLVMSTSAEIGRSPIALRRSCSQSGLGAVAYAADEPAEEQRAGLVVGAGQVNRDRAGGICPAPASCPAASACPIPSAARSRAMPRTPRQSARLGVTLTSITGSSSPIAAAKLAPTGEPRGQFDDAVMVLAQAELIARAQHAVGGDAADLARLQHHAGARDDRSPTGANTPIMPARALGAPHTTSSFSVPVSTQAKPQPVGVGMALGRDARARR